MRASSTRASVPPTSETGSDLEGAPPEPQELRGNQFAAQQIASAPPDDLSPGAVRARLAPYAELAPRFSARAARARALEEQWASGLGTIGATLERFGGSARPDPARWDGIVAGWEALVPRLAAATGDRATAAEQILELKRLAEAEQAARDSFLAHIGELTETAKDGVWLANATRDAAILGAVGAVTVAAFPAIASATAAGAGAAGLTGATASSASTAAALVGAAGVGGATEGGLRAGGALMSEMLEALEAANQAGQRALTEAEGIDWAHIGSEGWEGFERGIINGPLALVGANIEQRLLAGPASRALAGVRSRLSGELLQQMLDAAIAGGASGGVVGGLRAGLLALKDNAAPGEIAARMRAGFLAGLAGGASLGAAKVGFGHATGAPASAPTAPSPETHATATAGATAALVAAGAVAGSSPEAEAAMQGWWEEGTAALSERTRGIWQGAERLYDGAKAAATDAMEGAARVKGALSATDLSKEGGTYAIETDLDRVAPLLTGELRGAAPLDPSAANRARLELDTDADTVTLSVPDLKLGQMKFGDTSASGVTLEGLSLTVDGAKAVGRELAASVISPGALDKVFGGEREGRVRLAVSRLAATDLRGPGGAGAKEIVASDLQADLSAARGLMALGEGPAGIEGRFAVGSIVVRGLATPGTSADGLSVEGLALEGDPANVEASVGLRRLSARGVRAGELSLGAGEINGLRAEISGGSATPSWALPIDERSTASLQLESAKIHALKAAGASVDEASLAALGARKDAGLAGALSLRDVSARGLRAGGTRLGHIRASEIHARASEDRARAEVRALRAESVAAGGAQVGSLSSERLAVSANAGGREGALSIGALQARSVKTKAASVQQAEIAGLEVRADAGEGAPSWAVPSDLSKVAGSARLARASVRKARTSAGALGAARVDGLSVSGSLGSAPSANASVDKIVAADLSSEAGSADLVALVDVKGRTDGRGHAGSVGMLHAAGIEAKDAHAGHVTVMDASGSLSGERGAAHVGSASIDSAAGKGAELKRAAVSGADVAWGGGAAEGSVRAADVWDASWEGSGAEGRLGSASIEDVAGDLSRGSISAGRIEATSLSGSARLGGASEPPKEPAPKGGGAAEKGSGFDPVVSSRLVRDLDANVSIPLVPQRLGGSFLGADIRPGTAATIAAKVRQGAIAPEGTRVGLTQPIEGPLGVSLQGVDLERDRDHARVRPRLGGLPDVDVTSLIPGFQDGIPLSVPELAREGLAASSPSQASPGQAPAAAPAQRQPSPSVVSPEAISASARLRLGGDVNMAGVSGTLADRPGKNEIDIAANGTQDIVVRFIGLLVGALQVDLPQGSGGAQRAAVSGGRVSVRKDSAGQQVQGSVGSLLIEGVEGRKRP